MPDGGDGGDGGCEDDNDGGGSTTVMALSALAQDCNSSKDHWHCTFGVGAGALCSVVQL